MAIDSCFPQSSIPDPVPCNSVCELGPPGNCTEIYITDALAFGADPPVMYVEFIGVVSGSAINGVAYTVDGSPVTPILNDVTDNTVSYQTGWIPAGSVVYYVYDGTGDLAVDGSQIPATSFLVRVLN